MIKCDVAAVSGTGTKLTGKAAELDAFLKQILGEVEATAASWHGKGWDGFAALHARWNRAAGELQLVLHDYGSATTKAAGHYDETDGAVATMFGGG